MASYDLTTVGETMLRLKPLRGERLVSAGQLEVHVGGAESNVAAALAQLGRRTLWASQLPEGPLGRLVTDRLRAFGVDVSRVSRLPDARLGIYFLDGGGGALPPRVIYDRRDSAFSRLKSRDVDWDAIIDGRVVHITGITPALGREALALARAALTRARAAGRITSFDVNYRQRLWSPVEARDALAQLLPSVDVLFCSLRDARLVFGYEGDGPTVLQILQADSGIERVVMSLGPNGVLAADGTERLHVDAPVVDVVSRPGAGDALVAGVIDGLLDGDFPSGVHQGAALAALALTQNGDMVIVDRDELRAVMGRTTAVIDR